MIRTIFSQGARLAAAAALGASLFAGGAIAQTAETTDEPPAIDPEAVQAVKDMGAKLRELPAFSIKATLLWEEVFESGEKTAVIEQVRIDADPPHGLRVERFSAERSRIFYFNGEKATLWSPEIRYYTDVDFKGTIAEMIAFAAEKHDLELPLADLFLWGAVSDDFEAVTAARYVGQTLMGDRVCDQYAFRQEDIDWQIWIEDVEALLPCGYMIVDKTDEARPIFEATITMTPETEFADQRFTFTPPEDSQRIPFATAEDMKAEEKK